MSHWMMDCREISHMVSDSMDRTLPLYQRIGIRMHLMMCRYCARFRKHLLLLRKVIRLEGISIDEAGDDFRLPSASKKRINDTLQRHMAQR